MLKDLFSLAEGSKKVGTWKTIICRTYVTEIQKSCITCGWRGYRLINTLQQILPSTFMIHVGGYKKRTTTTAVYSMKVICITDPFLEVKV